MTIIEELEQEQIAKLTAERHAAVVRARATRCKVKVKVVEGTRERVQAFEGVCIARRNRGLNSSFTVRKISYGEGVERVFPLYSPSHRRHRGGAPRRRPPRQALLPAHAPRQERAHRREDRRLRRQGDRAASGRRRCRRSRPAGRNAPRPQRPGSEAESA